LMMVLIFAAVHYLTFYIIPTVINTPQIQFWYAFDTILFIQFLRKLERISNPLNSYQTIVIRKK